MVAQTRDPAVLVLAIARLAAATRNDYIAVKDGHERFNETWAEALSEVDALLNAITSSQGRP